MKKKSTKIIVILLVLVLIIAALAAGVGAMIFTGKIALTDRQKLIKGISDIKTRFSSEYTQEDTLMQDYEKMYTTPFESQTIITGKVNTLEIEGAESVQGASEILGEIKELVGKTKITSTVQADLKNSIVVENLKLEMGDVVEELSLDLEYNKDTIALRSKELNEKYLTITQDDVDSDSDYEELAEIFNAFELICEKPDFSQLELTEEEILHFQETYKGIFSKYLTDDMITSETATIEVDGQATNCSAVSVTFNKTNMQQIIGEYLKIFESDTTGKTIILNKLEVLEAEIDEEDIQELVDDIRSDLQTLPDDAKTVFTIYCNNFTTYGFDVVFADSEDSSIIKTVFGADVTIVKLVSSETGIGMSTATETELGTITISENEVNAVISAEETTMTLNVKQEENKTNVTVSMNADEVELSLAVTYEEITKTATEISEKYGIGLALKSEEFNIDVDLNADSSLKYIGSVSTTTFNNTNSLNMVTGSTTDLQQYLVDAMTKGQALLQTAQQNSTIINALMSAMQLNESQTNINTETEVEVGTIIDADTINSQAVQSFNSIFTNYQGAQKGSTVSMLLQTVSTNNQSALHKVKIIMVDQNNAILLNTDNASEIIIAQSDIVNTVNYTVAIAEYDTEGYIKTIAIKKN